MELQLSHTRVKRLRFDSKAIEINETSFNYRVDFSDEDRKSFTVEFNLAISDQEENYYLEITYEANFLTNDDITGDFIKSSFPKVNAPAIAFPYFRAYISLLTQQSGYNTVVLPSLNFVKLAQEKFTNEGS